MADWDESQHPRDDNGKFSGGGGGSKGKADVDKHISNLVARRQGQARAMKEPSPKVMAAHRKAMAKAIASEKARGGPVEHTLNTMTGKMVQTMGKGATHERTGTDAQGMPIVKPRAGAGGTSSKGAIPPSAGIKSASERAGIPNAGPKKMAPYHERIAAYARKPGRSGYGLG